MTWQTLDTAPTDKPVLVYDAHLKRSVVAQKMTAIEDGTSDWVYARQLAAVGMPAIAFVCKEPTHWQPLPDDPSH